MEELGDPEEPRFEDEFDPDWCIHPGTTLQDMYEESLKETVPYTPQQFIDAGITIEQLVGILVGTQEIDDDMAAAIAKATGSSTQFWINRERQFREGLAAGKEWTR